MTAVLEWLGIICALCAVVFAVPALLAYRRFRRSPEKRWRDQMFQWLGNARRRERLEQETLRRGGAVTTAEENDLRERAFRSYLAGISVAALEVYPNIGPATITRLRDAGYADLAACFQARVQVPGLGPRRAADVLQAAKQAMRDARSRFNARGCREAHEAERQLAQLRASRSEEGFRASARLETVRAALARMEPAVVVARQVIFPAYLLGHLESPAVRGMMRTELPDLEQAVRAADEKARLDYAARPPAAVSVEVPVATTAPADVVPAAIPTPSPQAADLFRHALETARTPQAVLIRPAAPPVNGAPTEESPLARLQLTAQFAVAVARADGRLARAEKAIIEEELWRRCGEDEVLHNRAKAFLAQYESAAFDLDGCLRQVAERFPLGERQALLDFACRITNASGGRNPREAALLIRIAADLGVPFDQAPPLPSGSAVESVPSHQVPAADPRAVLEIDPSLPLTGDLVRRQYNLLTERYAPEKFTSAGADFVTMAQAKRDAVKSAAFALLKPLGEPLETAPAEAPPSDLRHNPDLDAMFGA